MGYRGQNLAFKAVRHGKAGFLDLKFPCYCIGRHRQKNIIIMPTMVGIVVFVVQYFIDKSFWGFLKRREVL